MVPALLLFTVLAKADEPEVAEVTRTSNFDLAVTEIKEVTFSNVRKFSDPKSPKGDYPPEGIYYADVEFTVMLVPLACNTSYYRGEILGRIGAIGDHWDTNPTIKVDFGTLDTLGAGSTCPGLPPRQAHVKLWGVVNGIGKDFKNDRVLTYQFTAPRNKRTQNPEQWLVHIRANQSTGVLEVAGTERKSDEPVIPDEYLQKFECDMSGRFHKAGEIPEEDRLEVVVIKTAGDAADAKNYSVAVTGSSKSLFGEGSGKVEFMLTADPTPSRWGLPGTHLKFKSASEVELKVDLQTIDLGWKVNRSTSVDWTYGKDEKGRDKGRFSSCYLVDLASSVLREELPHLGRDLEEIKR
jgi:hypothetical protein